MSDIVGTIREMILQDKKASQCREIAYSCQKKTKKSKLFSII
jgi:hypothetical protein